MLSTSGRIFGRKLLDGVAKTSRSFSVFYIANSTILKHQTICSVNCGLIAQQYRHGFFSSSKATTNRSTLEPRAVIVENLESYDNKFRVELLNQYDNDLVCRFGFTHIRIAQPLAYSLNCSPDDLEILFYDECKRSIDSGISLIAFEKKKCEDLSHARETPDAVVLISTTTLEVKDRVNSQEFEFRDDYGDKVDAAGYLRRNANRVHVILDELKKQFPLFVPANVKKIGTIECFCVHPDYKSLNLDLEKKLVQEGVKLAKTDGVEYLSMICLTDEQRQIAAHLHFKSFMDFPLANFRDRDNVVFKPIKKKNGAVSDKLTLMIGKL